MEKLVELLGKLPEGTPEDIRSGIKTEFQRMSVEAGKAKTDLEGYKKGATEYSKLRNKLQDSGLSIDKLDDIAEELGVKKTLQDELHITKEANKELSVLVKTLQKEVKQGRMESVLGKKIEDASKAYKTADGKTIRIADEFIDKKSLYQEVDLDNDILVQDRVTKVLTSAFEKQAAFMTKYGINFEGQPVHKVPLGEATFGSGKALDESQVMAIVSKSNGDKEAAALALTMYEKAKAA